MRRDVAAVRHTEARVCSTLADADVESSPLSRRSDILEVIRIVASSQFGSVGDPATSALEFYFAQVPGLTRAWLQQALACHTARDAAAVHSGADVLLLPMSGVQDFDVEEVQDGVRVRLRVRDDAAARILLRAAHPRVRHIRRG